MNALLSALLAACALSASAHIPEQDLNATQLIQYYGYPVEEHDVTTEDGYILTMVRIPHGKTNGGDTKPRQPVFLQHGLGASCTCWITNLPHQSLSYILADAGYDVWMGNVRGNGFSRRHVSMTPDDKAFWDFTWQEMSKYDLPAMVDGALAENGGFKKIFYVGHSQGTLMGFTHFSEDTKWANEKIQTFFALAPVYTVGHLKAPLHLLAPYAEEIYDLWKLTGSENGGLSWIKKFISPICDNKVVYELLCSNLLFYMYGPEAPGMLNSTRVMLYVNGGMGGTSMKNYLHWAQLVNTDKCEKFDYGTDGDFEKYHCVKDDPFSSKACPPIYHTNKIKTDTVIYWSLADTFADETDAEALIQLIPEEYREDHLLDNYSHIDFLWANGVWNEIYAPILKRIAKTMASVDNRL